MTDVIPIRRLSPAAFEKLLFAVDMSVGPSGASLIRTWLDLQTGEVLEESTDELIDGQDDLLEEAEALRARLDDAPKRYVLFEPPETRAEYRWMAAFAEAVTDATARVRLLDSIDGPGAFGRFKRMLEKVELREQWFAFQREQQHQFAAAFLEDHGFRPPER
jgi:hypothetical protein